MASIQSRRLPARWERLEFVLKEVKEENLEFVKKQ